jgi:hypothetical protein
MILRELLFKLGIDFDGKGSKQAEASVDRLIGGFEALGGVIATAGAFKLFQGFVERASEVEETIARTRGLFGESSQGMIDWADRLSGSIGRDSEALLDMGAQAGRLAQGFGATEVESAKLSKGTAEMAANMASFYGMTDEASTQALVGALAGMDRGVKRLGISVNDAALEEQKHVFGVRKSVKSMNEREKVMLRYQIIQKALIKTDGAAAKSLERYAGASKALGVALEDTQEALGAQLLPGAVKMINIVREAVSWFAKLSEHTHIAQAALIGVSLVIGSMLWPHLVRLLVTTGPLIAAFAAFALVIDDVISAFSGGNSVLLGFANWLDKIEKENFPGWTAWFKGIILPVNALRDALGAMALLTFEGVNALLTGDFSVFKATASAIADSLISWVKSLEIVAFTIRVIKAEFGMLGSIGSSIANAVTAKQPMIRDLQGGGTLGARTSTGALTPGRTSNKTFNMTINQQPGEDTEFFARRVSEEIDKRDAAKDEALYYEFLPQGAQ